MHYMVEWACIYIKQPWKKATKTRIKTEKKTVKTKTIKKGHSVVILPFKQNQQVVMDKLKKYPASCWLFLPLQSLVIFISIKSLTKISQYIDFVPCTKNFPKTFIWIYRNLCNKRKTLKKYGFT